MYVQLDAQPLPALAARITLAVRPGLGTDINSSTFRVECVPMTSLYPSKATQVLVQVKYISIDAGMRILLDENVPWAHAPAIKIGETMRAETVGLVVQVHPTYCSALEVGDEVLCNAGWVTYGLVEETDVKKIMYVSLPAETPFAAMQYLMERRSQDHDAIHAIDYLGSLGGTGLTAYFGLTDIGKIKHGETCVISGAAGAVGSMACQIAKIQGTKVFGIAGGPAKCKYLEEELGVDKALDYKDPNFVAQFKKHVGRLDVFFDNVGGYMLDLALDSMNKHARIVICGAVSQYGKKPTGITGTLNLMSQAARMEGFSVWDYRNQYPEAVRTISRWIEAGKVKRKFYIAEPFERCPEHLANLLKGINVGKMVVRV